MNDEATGLQGETADDAPQELERLLEALRTGTPSALDQIISFTYAELKALARSRVMRLNGAKDTGTLRATVLVGALYDRFRCQGRALTFENKRHFYGASAIALGHIILDALRARKTKRRGGDVDILALTEITDVFEDRIEDHVALKMALERLAEKDSELAYVFCMRFFEDKRSDEIGQILGRSARTVERRFEKARLMLRVLMEGLVD